MTEQYHVTDFIINAVQDYSYTIVKIAFTYVRNTEDAEDITQEVFLALMDKQPKFLDNQHLKAWLIRVTINKCKDFLKSVWFKNRCNAMPELSYLPDDQSETLYAVLSLQIKYRLPIHLYYYEGYSIKEIAQILNERPSTIGTRLARGREKLKEKIGGFCGEGKYLQNCDR